MGNRVSFLDLRRAPTPDASGSVCLNPEPGEFVAEASDCLPLFWATLFNVTDMGASRGERRRSALPRADRANGGGGPAFA